MLEPPPGTGTAGNVVPLTPRPPTPPLTPRPPTAPPPTRQLLTTQEAVAAGVTPGQLRGPRWRNPFRGVHELADVTETILSRCRALARVLPPEAAFSGITAAQLNNWWLPRGAQLLPLHVTVPPDVLIDRPGVRTTRRLLDAADVVEHEGLRLTVGPRTLADLAADWSLIDVVVLSDAALRRGDCSPADLARIAGLRGGRGVRTLRQVVALADGRSDSPMETVLRLMIVLPGLPAPTPQAVIRDPDGGWLAQVDLLGADGKSVLEYDGAEHDEPKRHAADATRWRMLRREGYEVYPYTARDIYFGSAQVIGDYQRALGLPSDPRPAQAWLREWQRSSFARRPR